MSRNRYRYDAWLDRGGTFTDGVVRDRRTGRLQVGKVPSGGADVAEALARLLGLGPGAPVPPCDVRIGTTLVTNLALEGGGAPAALLVTEGLEDVASIGDQARPELFDLRVRPRKAPCERVVPVPGRRAADGSPLKPLDLEALSGRLAALRAEGVEAVGIVLLHARRAPEDELVVAELAERLGFRYVACSHQVAPGADFTGRLLATALDARLTPPLRAWLRRLGAALPGSRLRLATSAGTLVAAEEARAPLCLLSGPAAGAVAVAGWARRLGVDRVVGLDMGGTSTDVVRVAGAPPLRDWHEVAGWSLAAPAVDVHTVAAGGGSTCRLERGRPAVGPRSVGADPGPLCYGRPEARDLSLIDVLLWLGRLPEDRLPFVPRREPVEMALERLAAEAGLSTQRLAEGFLEVALERMAAAVRRISVERGADPREHPLLVYGGAGGMLACELAERLGSPEVIWPPWPGVLSAWGLAHAPIGWRQERSLHPAPLSSAALAALQERFEALERAGRAELRDAEAEAGRAAEAHREVLVRYRGTAEPLAVRWGEEAEVRSRFDRQYCERYGFTRPDHPVELVGFRLRLELAPDPLPAPSPAAGQGRAAAGRNAPVRWGGRTLQARVMPREALAAGARLEGPACLLDETATFFLPPGWTVEAGPGGVLRARRVAAGIGEASSGDAGSVAEAEAERPDPVSLEVFHHAFAAVAERMGAVLGRSAVSANIRERRDFSCALFDARGRLVASAPHIPVHLGAMGETVRAVLAARGRFQPGEAFAVNDPAMGGTHLPDVTVVAPLLGPGGELRAFVAARGHHADLGGRVPGSMPADSRSLREEGVLFRGERIARAGRFEEARVRELLGAGPWPARRPEENVADLLAQLAACRAGAEAFEELVARRGWDRVRAYMDHVLDDGEAAVREALAALLPPGWHGRFEDALDDGTPLRVALWRPASDEGAALVVDFAGSGAQHPGNLNAPVAVTRACLLYVLRCLVQRPMPLNEGCLRAVELRLPAGSLLSPAPGAAVAGGNVETSQRVVDVLLGALGLCAASQGTMNNVAIGGEGFAHYETVGGGVGAAEGYHGASGVHVHMTNARITDPEVLEERFPLRLWRFSLRRGSGGAGRFRGGDGLVREIELLAPATVSLTTQRRRRRPYGARGGEPGAAGRNLLDGRELPPVCVVRAEAGSRLRLETPGGGGWGAPGGGEDRA